MKKLTAILTVAALAFSALAFPAYAESTAEEVLAKVKSTVEIDDETLTEFNYSANNYDGENEYDFYWNDENYTKDLSITADSEGRITYYYYYEDGFYNDGKKLILTTQEEAEAAARDFLESLYPEYFDEDSADELTLTETDTSSGSSSKRFNFMFDFYHSGTRVDGSYVSISLTSTGDALYVTSMYANLDFDAQYDSDAAGTEYHTYRENFPIELSYEKTYDNDTDKAKAVLRYTLSKGYTSISTGEIITEDTDDNVMYAKASDNDEASADESSGDGGMQEKLTQAELDELTKMNSLMSREDLEKALRGISELKITDDMTVTSCRAYKTEDGYSMYMFLESDEDSEDVRYVTAYFDAATGKLYSVYNEKFRHFDDTDSTEEEEAAAALKAEEFVKSYAPEEYASAQKDADSTQYYAIRTVNGVDYPGNHIRASYDAKNDRLSYYSIVWDKDVSDFPSPDTAIEASEAYDKALEIQPIETVYVKCGGKYVKADTIGDTVCIDAVTAEDVWSFESDAPEAYDDIAGHWAENEIKALLNNDIYLPGKSFNPDAEITRADALRLFDAAQDSYGYDYDRILKKLGLPDGLDPDETITREEAFGYFTEAMGIGNIARLDIYKASYSDADKFTGGVGSAEILKGMGVLQGDEARPQDMMTRAEAAVMAYRYLRKH